MLPETSFSFEILTIVTSYSNQLNQKIKAMGRAIGRLKTATGQPFFSSAAHAVYRDGNSILPHIKKGVLTPLI
jgi:hypothetical protein